MGEGFTKGPWDMSKHKTTNPNQWQIKQHEFSEYPYEGDLVDEWGVYPPLGESGPVALVAGEKNARLIAANPDMLDALEDVKIYFREYRAMDLTDFERKLYEKINAVIQKVEAQNAH